MPYLDSKIDLNKHKKNCFNPVGKRLYIRDYDDNGKQKFVSWGLTCTTCGVVVKDKYERNLTKQERRQNDRGSLEFHRKYKIRHKLERLQRRRMGGGPISPEENGLRRIIRGFRDLYKLDNLHWSIKEKNSIKWPVDLSEQFLNMGPRPTVEELKKVIHSSPLHRYNNGADKYRYRGYIPDPDKPGWLKYAGSHWVSDPKNPKEKIYDHDNLTEYEKLLIKEASIRQKLMIDMMRSRGIDYKPDTVVVAAYEKAEAAQKKKFKEMAKAMVGEMKKKH